MPRFAKKSSSLFAATLAVLSLANSARADITFDVRALSVKGPGLTLNNPHSVSVSDLGGTIQFGVFAVISNRGDPAPNDAFQSARGYLLAGLPTDSGNVPGNNGPIGNLSNGLMVAPFNANGSVGPPGSGASQNTTATADLNADSFSDFGSLLNDPKLALIPRSGGMTPNSANGPNGSAFLFFTFSMIVVSRGADPAAGSTSISFVTNARAVAILYEEAGIPKIGNAIGPSIPTLLTNAKPGAKPAATKPAPPAPPATAAPPAVTRPR